MRRNLKYQFIVSIKHINDQVAPRRLMIEVEAPSRNDALSEALEKAKYINFEELHNRNFTFVVEDNRKE